MERTEIAAISEEPGGGFLPFSSTGVFSLEQLRMIRSIAHPVKLPEGETLYYENDPVDCLYLLYRGTIRISKALKDGSSATIALHIPGDLFGEWDPVGRSVCPFEAQATEDTEVGMIPQKKLADLIADNGDLALAFTQWLAVTNRTMQSKFRDLLLHTKSGALCSVLIRLHNMYGLAAGSSPDAKAIMIGKRITNAEMAEMIGSTRESVNRILQDLRNLGVISLDRGRIVLHDRAYLESVCNCPDCPREICRM